MPHLPTGTLTFVFTDIAGSTRLWEDYPDVMQVVHTRHKEHVLACVERHGGTLVRRQGEGDSTFSVFPDAVRALAAICALQRALHAESWPADISVGVRAALHTGVGEVIGSDYHSSEVNRCARLRAIAHGGQTLLSQSTYDRVADRLPAGVGLRDLGLHRLQDLRRPERVYQLLHPALPADFPPLRSLDALPTNLPVQLTSFIGREREMAEVKGLLGGTRLLTLTGVGGCGKTRLALQVGAEALEEFADGVWLVELAALSDPGLVVQAALSALGLREEPGRPLLPTLIGYLQSRSLLLVLDNCEHLLGACARLVTDLLERCPRLKVLATSREALNAPGELAWRVPSLLAPVLEELPLGEQEIGPALMGCDATRLFVERAVFSRAGFALTPQSARAIVEICHRLDGIPLAIELAAARVRALTPEQIAGRLADRFRLLTGGSRAALPRQQTLRALIGWSYDLLSEEERVLLRRLSVFVGGFTLAAVAAVCGVLEGGMEVSGLLSHLVDKSLALREEGESAGEARYRLLETVRQYGRERLVESGEAVVLQDRHRAYFLALAEEAHPHLSGPEQGEWLARLELEHPNLRAALEWGLASGVGSPAGGEAGLRMAGALWRFWLIRGHLTEGREHLQAALSQAEAGVSLFWRAKALHGAGTLASHQGDYAAACRLLEESVEIRRALGDRAGVAASLGNLATAYRYMGDYARARALGEECLALYRELGDRLGIAGALTKLGSVTHNQGDRGAARAFWEESLAIDREIGDEEGIAISLTGLALLAQERCDCTAARALYEQSLNHWRALGHRSGLAHSLHGLGLLALEQGDYAAAQDFLKESLLLRKALSDQRGIADLLEGMARLAVAQQQFGRAARLLGAGEALCAALGVPLSVILMGGGDQNIAIAREALGEEAFATEWTAGRAMTPEQAIGLALNYAVGV